MPGDTRKGRREFLGTVAAVGCGATLGGIGWAGQALAVGQDQRKPGAPAESQPAVDIGPNEDLMREHGVLRRVLLVYEECARRIDEKGEVPPRVLVDAAGLVRRFVEDYHERLEEQQLFPRLVKGGKLAALVEILLEQHQAGRRLTEQVQSLATAAALKDPEQSRKLAAALRAFIRMYRPHAAREDTMLFPAFHELLSPQEYDVLGDQFEDQERALFGERGFEKAVEQVAGFEKTLGIEDLGRFTPRA